MSSVMGCLSPAICAPEAGSSELGRRNFNAGNRSGDRGAERIFCLGDFTRHRARKKRQDEQSHELSHIWKTLHRRAVPIASSRRRFRFIGRVDDCLYGSKDRLRVVLRGVGWDPTAGRLR